MSSLTSEDAEKTVDAIVLAGSRGARPFELHGQRVEKPFLELGGEPLVCRVARALLQAAGVGSVYVVGRADRLAIALRPLVDEHGSRLCVVEEGDDILDNCYRAYFLHLLPGKGFGAIGSPRLDPQSVIDYLERNPEARSVPALFVTSDLPFLTPQAVDRFLSLAPEDAEVAMGIVNHKELEKVRAALGEKTALDFWKLGAIHLLEASVRINNLFLTRPLRVHPPLYALLQSLYAHRWLLQRDGSVHSGNWWAITRAIVSFSMRSGNRLRSLRAVLNFLPAVVAMILARLTHRVGRWLSWPFRLFLRKRDMEFIASTLFGVRGCMPMSPDPGPAIDIDVVDSYLSLVRDDEREFRLIVSYLSGATGSKDNDPDLKAMAGG